MYLTVIFVHETVRILGITWHIQLPSALSLSSENSAGALLQRGILPVTGAKLGLLGH